MIIFGTKAKFNTIGSGKFHCPRCQQERDYILKEGKKYFSIYFIPIIPMGDIGQFVECSSCSMTYQPEIINYKPVKKQPDVTRYLNTIKTRLEGGHPVEYMIRDLTAEGLDREVANNMVSMAIGTERKQCPQCELSYAGHITTCNECGSSTE
jgi:hypothetical protein